MKKLKNEELDRLTTAEFKAAKKTPIVLVLDNIRSMNNIGSAFRTSDAFRIDKIYLSGITAQPPHRDIQKTALGATDTVSWQYVKDPVQCVLELKEQGYKVQAVEQAKNSTRLQDFSPKITSKLALVFGNEVKGVSDDVMQVVDGCLEIPQIGSKHSLNISVSIGVVLWDISNKLGVF